MNGERAIHIERRDIADLGDLLNVARCVGKKVLRVDRVRVSPQVSYVDNGFIVMVSASEKNGKQKADVERKENGKQNPGMATF